MLPKEVDHLRLLKICNVYAAKNLGILLPIILKKYCSYCKKKRYIIKECRIHPQNRQTQAFHTSVPSAATSVAHGSFSSATSDIAPHAAVYCTPEMVQHMLISALSAMGFQGKNSTTL